MTPTCTFTDPSDPLLGEIEVMIACEESRGRGLGKEIVLAMMKFAKEILGTKRLIARIKFDNEPSQKLFKRLGFVESSRSEFFREITLLLDMSSIDLDHVSLQYELIQ